MDIRFADRKLGKECSDARLLKRRHGERRARLLKTRLAVLAAVSCLADIGLPYRGPMRCHESTGNRAGQLSIDLDQPCRLILLRDHDPLPERDVGGLDGSRANGILILENADTHE